MRTKERHGGGRVKDARREREMKEKHTAVSRENEGAAF